MTTFGPIIIAGVIGYLLGAASVVIGWFGTVLYIGSKNAGKVREP
jgi:hypothetical protein